MRDTAGVVGCAQKWHTPVDPFQMDEQRQDDQLEPIYSSSVPIQDIALKTCQKQWTIEKGGEKESNSSIFTQLNGFQYSKWLNISIWHIDGTLTGTTTLGQWTWSNGSEGYSTFLKAPELDSHHQMVWYHIQNICWMGGSYLLCRGGIFYSLNRLGWSYYLLGNNVQLDEFANHYLTIGIHFNMLPWGKG